MQVFEYLVFPKLSLKDLVQLKQVNKQFCKKINLPVIACKKVETKLREILGEKYVEFAQAMYNCRGIISGSFVLSCILDEEWPTFDREMKPQARDIDVYVGCLGNGEKGNVHCGSIYKKQDKRNMDHLRKFLSTLTNKVAPDHHGMYKSLFRRLLWLENFYFKKEGDARLDYDGENRLVEYEDETKFQLISIETDKDYSIWDHIKSTGFAICRNRVTFDENGKIALFMSRPLEIIHKKSTFILQDIDDFFYRCRKYTRRGFTFRCKYNKIFYLEYFYRDFTHTHEISVRFNEKRYNEKKKNDKLKCGINCPIKLLYGDRKHYHEMEENEIKNRHPIRVATVDNSDGAFNAILPTFKRKCERNKRDREFMITYPGKYDLPSFPDLEEYVLWRGEVEDVVELHPYAKTNTYEYDITYDPAKPEQHDEDN